MQGKLSLALIQQIFIIQPWPDIMVTRKAAKMNAWAKALSAKKSKTAVPMWVHSKLSLCNSNLLNRDANQDRREKCWYLYFAAIFPPSYLSHTGKHGIYWNELEESGGIKMYFTEIRI